MSVENRLCFSWSQANARKVSAHQVGAACDEYITSMFAATKSGGRDELIAPLNLGPTAQTSLRREVGKVFDLLDLAKNSSGLEIGKFNTSSID